MPSDNYDEALWDVVFNLDDWDICIESDKRLVCEVDTETGDRWLNPVDEAWRLVYWMSSNHYRYNEVEYNGKWYYTVHLT